MILNSIVILCLFGVKYVLSGRFECECYTPPYCCLDSCELYTGGEGECLCWINDYIQRANATKWKFVYLPHSKFSKGGCSWCGTEYRNPTEKYQNFKSLQKADPGPIFMEYHVCFEDPSCKHFSGSYGDCLGWCEDYQNRTQLFVHGYQVTYLPPGKFSNGGCLMKGDIDPCRSPVSHHKELKIHTDDGRNVIIKNVLN